ncbi:MAG TPA: hypothetical protein VEB22_05755 [Phycisphaerales bacterium]|nr:hypothetical protein [Phycisphaerales bacterium]
MKKLRPPEKVGSKRRSAGWTLLTLGVVVAAVWVASGWRSAFWGRMRGDSLLQIWVAAGVLHVEYVDPVPDLRPTGQWTNSLAKVTWDWSWQYQYFSNAPKSQYQQMRVRQPLWPTPLLLWSCAALLFRSGILARRRALKGICAKCGYSLAGLGDGAACPECGKPSSTLSTQDSSLKTSF